MTYQLHQTKLGKTCAGNAMTEEGEIPLDEPETNGRRHEQSLGYKSEM